MKKTLFITTLILCCTQAFAENYQIIVDAGSSGSKLHLFQYETTQGAPIIKDIFAESNKTPLSSFEKNPENAGASLEKLLDDAMTQLKSKEVNPNQVQVNILATAGMRLLPEDKQAAIYKNVSGFLQQHYTFQIGKIETISGKMEGLYDWLDVNYLANTFQNHKPSVGTIDMGGASTQIAFETRDASQPNDLSTLKINGQTYTVFSKSFLGLGQDQARGQLNKLPAAESCYPTGYQLQQSTGAWHLAQCASLYTQVINAHHVTEQIISTAGKNFYAFSGAYYTYQFLDADKTPDQASLEKRIQTVCTKSWNDLKKDYPQIDETYLSTYCANAAYMDDLFYRTYQLQNGQLSIVNKINNQSVDWTLGALIYSLS